MGSFKWEDVPCRCSKMRPMMRKILNHPWIVCSHPLTLLSVLRHLWPRGRSQEGPEASLHLSGELASDGPHRAHRNQELGTDHTVLPRVPIQQGATAVFVSFSLPSVKQNYGVRATGQQCTEAGDICAICQAEFREPLVLMCQVSRAGRDRWRWAPRDHRALPHAGVPGACPLPSLGALGWVSGKSVVKPGVCQTQV